jgi:hypothetical protein
MSTRDADGFRTLQAAADLGHAATSMNPAAYRGIADGAGRRPEALARRLRWCAEGKAPPSALRRDPEVFAALLVASALPEEDPPAFRLATLLLLLERLDAPPGSEAYFWSWRRLAPHWRRADPPCRAAIMCGFREGLRRARVAFDGGPGPADCLTSPQAEVLAALVRDGTPATRALLAAVRDEVPADEAGRLWSAQHALILALPDPARRAALAAVRYLYERPASLSLPAGADVPTIPPPA